MHHIIQPTKTLVRARSIAREGFSHDFYPRYASPPPPASYRLDRPRERDREQRLLWCTYVDVVVVMLAMLFSLRRPRARRDKDDGGK